MRLEVGTMPTTSRMLTVVDGVEDQRWALVIGGVGCWRRGLERRRAQVFLLSGLDPTIIVTHNIKKNLLDKKIIF